VIQYKKNSAGFDGCKHLVKRKIKQKKLGKRSWEWRYVLFGFYFHRRLIGVKIF
jgi:hypothetical protein